VTRNVQYVVKRWCNHTKHRGCAGDTLETKTPANINNIDKVVTKQQQIPRK